MPEPFHAFSGTAAPLVRPNIDTDTISPGSRPGGRPPSANIADDLFAGWRYDRNGAEVPDFVLNRPAFRDAKILLAGRNFGCGSSRESAVWMLKAWGLRCIVAPSFGDIFYGSCFTNGLLPVRLDEDTVAELAAQAEPGAPDALFFVDLAREEIRTPAGATIRIEVPAIRRHALLHGLDEIAQTLERAGDIARFESEAVRRSPWLQAR
jgi:3-isopropylmalate/(R)-2-methylmalate dehydratase small subunit